MTRKFDDPKLKSMFLTISCMARSYESRPWPTTVEQWTIDMKNEHSLTGLKDILFLLRSRHYVNYKGGGTGGTLTCHAAKILETANQMPAHLKLNGPSNPCASVFPANRQFRLTDGTQCYLIDEARFLPALDADPIFQILKTNYGKLNPTAFLALDCEGVPDALKLIQIATESSVYLIDCQVLGAEAVCRKLRPLLSSKSIVKLIHDLHQDAVALERFGSIHLEGVLDTQLVAEHMFGEFHLGFNGLLSKLGLATHPSKEFVHARMRSGVDLWGERPIPQNILEYAAMDVTFLLSAKDSIVDLLTNRDLDALVVASSQRASTAIENGGKRGFCFDLRSKSYALASPELVRTMRVEEGFYGEQLIVESNVDEVIGILPLRLQKKFVAQPAPVKSGNPLAQLFGLQNSGDQPTQVSPLPFDKLSDIVLDVGRRPQCWIGDERVFLCEDDLEIVENAEIKHIEGCLGQFGGDNRAGLNGKLHRFSAMRNRDKEISGITVRIGRHVRGNAAMLMDFLLGSDKSILILGEPGSGKTTIVREATRRLADSRNVVVVDTSNEIAGDGMVPHSCIGLARRMMVPSLDAQSSVMVECVQNHTPHVMVIDEIGRPREVQAARTVKQRGVRMIASAHGDLRSLLKNKDLVGLVGGVENVTMGDEMAKEEAIRKAKMASKMDGEKKSFSVSKTKVQRGGDPTFEVIVEVSRESRHVWRVVSDSAKAVDNILEGFRYKAQLRARNPDTGEMSMELVEA